MKVGDKIRIINMDGEPHYVGKKGTVTHIDDAGQIHGTWGGCALIPGVDEYEVIDTIEAQAIAMIFGTYALLYVVLNIMEMWFGIGM